MWNWTYDWRPLARKRSFAPELVGLLNRSCKAKNPFTSKRTYTLRTEELWFNVSPVVSYGYVVPGICCCVGETRLSARPMTFWSFCFKTETCLHSVSLFISLVSFLHFLCLSHYFFILFSSFLSLFISLGLYPCIFFFLSLFPTFFLSLFSLMSCAPGCGLP